MDSENNSYQQSSKIATKNGKQEEISQPKRIVKAQKARHEKW